MDGQLSIQHLWPLNLHLCFSMDTLSEKETNLQRERERDSGASHPLAEDSLCLSCSRQADQPRGCHPGALSLSHTHSLSPSHSLSQQTRIQQKNSPVHTQTWLRLSPRLPAQAVVEDQPQSPVAEPSKPTVVAAPTAGGQWPDPRSTTSAQAEIPAMCIVFVTVIVITNQDFTTSRLLPGSSYSCCIHNLHALVHKQCHPVHITSAHEILHRRQWQLCKSTLPPNHSGS
jgi:hypothetical protein